MSIYNHTGITAIACQHPNVSQHALPTLLIFLLVRFLLNRFLTYMTILLTTDIFGWYYSTVSLKHITNLCIIQFICIHHKHVRININSDKNLKT